jgi:LysM repeat protein
LPKESKYSIARKYGITVKELDRANPTIELKHFELVKNNNSRKWNSIGETIVAAPENKEVSTPETVVVAEPVKEVSKSEEAVVLEQNRAVSTKKHCYY